MHCLGQCHQQINEFQKFLCGVDSKIREVEDDRNGSREHEKFYEG